MTNYPMLHEQKLTYSVLGGNKGGRVQGLGSGYMNQEVGAGAHTVHELMAMQGVRLRQFLEGLQDTWPRVGEEHIAGERGVVWVGSLRTIGSRSGGGIVC